MTTPICYQGNTILNYHHFAILICQVLDQKTIFVECLFPKLVFHFLNKELISINLKVHFTCITVSCVTRAFELNSRHLILLYYAALIDICRFQMTDHYLNSRLPHGYIDLCNNFLKLKAFLIFLLAVIINYNLKTEMGFFKGI